MSARLDVVRDPADRISGSPPVALAIDALVAAWAGRGGSARVLERRSHRDVIGGSGPVLFLGTADAPRDAPGDHATLDSPESFELRSRSDRGRPSVVARGSDVRGTTYAVVELADRVEHMRDAAEAFRLASPIVGRPANTVRSVTRLFCSDVEDLGWFRDERFWRRYLAMLVAQRFGRFSLTLGLGYNYHRDVTDAYLYFAYPFLVSVPGYDVRVPQLVDEERERNLAALRFISDHAVARGLDFQLGLWTHAYAWIDSPNARQTVEGLTPETHASYCRDALRTLLEACPSISGVTFRVHGESGVPEGSWEFWRTVFQGIADVGRRIGIDLHAKGLDQRTLGSALDTELPVTVSTKFWAEHMGLPYHQAAIRERERLPRDDPSAISEWHRFMRVSEGSRPFTRYGYGDLLRDDRPYDVVFRLWAGTQRVLLWGDPAFAAGYGRAASLAGTQGLEWCEPLTFKGREGTGVAGSRTAYADPSLVPGDDWEKYAYTYRLFGRLTYDPDASAEEWRRPLPALFGSVAADAEAALASASRILPLVTVAHHPSASNNYYWPEIYTDMPIVWPADGTRPHPYQDTPDPRRFGTVGPLDPEVFSSVTDFVAERLAGGSSGRISPLEVAARLDALADDANRRNAMVEASRVPDDVEARRWVVDVSILAALGRFFAAKLRAAVEYETHLMTSDTGSLHVALQHHRAARAAWVEAAGHADVYASDLTFGPQPWIRGHWLDRLDAVDADVEAMVALVREVDRPASAGRVAMAPPPRAPTDVALRHEPPSIRHGSALPIELGVSGPGAPSVESARLRYRPMDQSRAYSETEMQRDGDRFVATIPGGATSAPYPIEYAFIVGTSQGAVWRHPGLGADLIGCPYFVTGGAG